MRLKTELFLLYRGIDGLFVSFPFQLQIKIYQHRSHKIFFLSYLKTEPLIPCHDRTVHIGSKVILKNQYQQWFEINCKNKYLFFVNQRTRNKEQIYELWGGRVVLLKNLLGKRTRVLIPRTHVNGRWCLQPQPQKVETDRWSKMANKTSWTGKLYSRSDWEILPQRTR